MKIKETKKATILNKLMKSKIKGGSLSGGGSGLPD